MGKPATVSVIIPTLNEEARLSLCLRHLLRVVPDWEILVADGGSTDGTIGIAESFRASGVIPLVAPTGRGPQLNAGAALATGDVLLFLHADVALPEDAASWVSETLSEPSAVAGAFRIRTVAEGARSPFRALLPLADIRSRVTSLPYGDQALFVRAEAFRRAGGFADIPLMEDLDFVRRLRRLGRIRVVPSTVTVSGRRFLARPIRSAISWSLFPLLYRLGVSPGWLARLYGAPR